MELDDGKLPNDEMGEKTHIWIRKFPIALKMSLQEQGGNDENCTGTSNWTLNTNRSRASTICCGGNLNGNDQDDLKELKLKMATMEAKNQMLEAKLENLKLLAENRALKEESNLNKLKEENKEIRARMEAAEQKANKLETCIQEIRQEIRKGIQRKVEVGKKLEEVEEEEEEETQQSKKLINPLGNVWNRDKTMANISPTNGLNAHNSDKVWYYAFSLKPFTNRQTDNFGGTVIQYFEVTRSRSKRKFYVGLSNGNLSDGKWMENKNYYDFGTGLDFCWLSGKEQKFDWPNGAIKPKWNGHGDVVGCGLLQSPDNKLAIFFTVNGLLLGKQIQICSPPFDHFFPTVNLKDVSVEANFGDDLAKPFKYDIQTCPGLVFDSNLP